MQQKQNSWDDKMLINLFKTLVFSILVVYLFAIFLSPAPSTTTNANDNPNCHSASASASERLSLLVVPPAPTPQIPTNVTHIVFGISGSAAAWNGRRSYIESWWVPNVTRGYVFLDQVPPAELLPWAGTSPPLRISEDTSNFGVHSRHIMPSVIRVVRVILETFRQRDKGVRWFVMCDDDTIFVVENLVEVLSKYDHNKYYYIGGTSECTKSNFDFSYEMAFGGAGFALSYPLAEMLVRHLDGCISRYPFFHVSDRILQSCISDLGVSLTLDKGFHQIDLVGDISGLLSAHPQSPLVSLHHFDIVHPIFPRTNRHNATRHLMVAAKADHRRILQQTVCHRKENNWTFSVSWGYSAHIYEQIIPRNILRRPLETFKPWSEKAKPPLFMFNTRPVTSNPCEAPHVFFFKSTEFNGSTNQFVSIYVRGFGRRLPACAVSGNHSADFISKIKVFSPATNPPEDGRNECCDFERVGGKGTTAELKYRDCIIHEMTA